MAYHGNRSAPRNRGSGFQGRGGQRSSRGRGRGGASLRRGRGRPIFDSARVGEVEVEESDAGKDGGINENETKENEIEDISSEEESAEELVVQRPYAALLQSLAVDEAPQAKRLKVEIKPTQDLIADQVKDPILDESNDIDHAEEEEGPELDDDGLSEVDEHDVDNSPDPFEAHFANPDDNILSRRLKSLELGQWLTHRSSLPIYGKAVISIPDDIKSGEILLPAPVSGYAALKLKQKLASSVSEQPSLFNSLERFIAPCLFNYHDVLFCGRTHANSESLRRLACLHAVNHILKTRDRVIKNSARLAKEDKDLDLRDQGFTRPKVLMLLPTRQSCARMIAMIISLCQPDQQEYKKRFEESYMGNDEILPAERPEDFRELFGGNDDDMFRLGMKFTRKTVKYFSQFYNSDIIFASPLGLRTAIGSEGDKKVDNDFLSSIEVVIVDQAESLPMQNWEHVEFIFENLNLQPKEAHGCDFSRVRSWYLDNNAQHFRQTIALSAFNTPELNTLFFNKSTNWAGKIKVSANYPGALQELGLKIKQMFSRLEPTSFSTDPDTRFTYFTTAIIPSLIRHSKDSIGTIIFIPSYLDFVRVRNYFSTSTTTSYLSFGIISEYTSVPDVARARSHFYKGRHKILLYTERAHHFRRYQLRGVRKVIMYGLPDNPIFYKEITGGYLGKSIQEGIIEPGEASVRVMFSKWDILKLERVAGTERVGKMIQEKGDTFDFL